MRRSQLEVSEVSSFAGSGASLTRRVEIDGISSAIRLEFRKESLSRLGHQLLSQNETLVSESAD